MVVRNDNAKKLTTGLLKICAFRASGRVKVAEKFRNMIKKCTYEPNNVFFFRLIIN